MYKVTAQAPTRVDLAGGTIDLWPIHQCLSRRATLNIGLSLRASVTVEQTESQLFRVESVDQKIKLESSFEDLIQDPVKFPIVSLLTKAIWQKKWGGLRIKTHATSPAGAGLGGSSCLSVVVAAALLRMRSLIANLAELDETALVNLVMDVESSIIKVPPGCQDYWGAVRGGLNSLRFPPGHLEVQTKRGGLVHALNQHLVVCYSGQSRASGINNWAIFKKFFDGDQEMIAGLNKIGELAEQSLDFAQKEDMHGLLKVSAQEWQVRKNLFPQIETAHTQKLAQIGVEQGAYLSRVCGAGGGGVMVFFAPGEKISVLKSALTQAGGQVLEAQLCDDGLLVKHES